jgi:ABC-type multidrug transport system fused ATPase/permease subunit
MTALENENQACWLDYSPTFQKYSCGLSLINCCILLSLGGCLLLAPSFVIHVLLDYSTNDDDDDDSLPPQMLLSVTRMAGGVLLAQGLSSIGLSTMLLKDWYSGSRIIQGTSVTTHRIAIVVQSVTGLLWVIIGLLDDRMTTTTTTTTKTTTHGGDPSEEHRRETFGLLVVGFAVLILSCWALMLSYWPVDDDDNDNDNDDEMNPEARNVHTTVVQTGDSDLTEPLLASEEGHRDEHANAEVMFRPLEEDQEDATEVNNDSSSENDDNDEHIPTSRIRGTRRLLKLAAPQVTYLYIGCVTLLVRLPFSLSIPHFVSTTLGALARGDYVQARAEIFWLFLLGTLDACLDFWCIFWFGYANLRIVRGVRIDTFAAILRQEMAFFDKHTSGELASRLTSDCGEMAGGERPSAM